MTMFTIVRLRGLDTKASSEDVRKFFGDFKIPDGGVFIVGGTFGEAFIAFQSEEEGSLALQLHGQLLMDSHVDLHISSMLEVEHKFDVFLKSMSSSSKSSAKHKVRPFDARTAGIDASGTTQLPVRSAEDSSLDTKRAFLLGVCTLLQGLPSSQTNVAASDLIEHPSPHPTTEVIPGYIRVFGLPLSTTRQDICHFFKGLDIQEVLLNVKIGIHFGSLVKFGSFQDATDALSFNKCSLGTTCVEVRTATEKMWLSVLNEHKDVSHEEKLKHNPLKDTQNFNYNNSKRSRKRTFKQDLQNKSENIESNGQSTDAPTENQEHIVMVSNLPVTITKTEIKELFGCPDIAHTNVLHLLDTYKNRTDKAFVIFYKREDYDYAINLSGCHVGLLAIDVKHITKEQMNSMMDKSLKQNTSVKTKQKLRKRGNDIEEQNHELCTTARTCVYIRNMPADVRKSQIRAIFTENKLREEDITLLHDSDGMSSGEAVVQFQSQTNAALALMHHGMEFLGSKLLLTPISVKQMENILANN